MTRAALILSAYDREVARYNLSLRRYRHAVALGNLFAADILAPIVRRRAAAIIATIAECSPEGGA